MAIPLEDTTDGTLETLAPVEAAKFDDIVITDPMLQYMPVPVGYKGLYWQDMYAILLGGGSQANNQPPAGLQPHSGSQAAVFKPSQMGLLGIGPATATLTRDYLTSGIKSFDLKEFWFGCALTSPQAIVQTPQACTVDVFGYRAGQNAPSAAANFVFFGNSYVTAPLAQAKLPDDGSFKGLEKIVFQRRSVGLADQATESVVLDDVMVVPHMIVAN